MNKKLEGRIPPGWAPQYTPSSPSIYQSFSKNTTKQITDSIVWKTGVDFYKRIYLPLHKVNRFRLEYNLNSLVLFGFMF